MDIFLKSTAASVNEAIAKRHEFEKTNRVEYHKTIKNLATVTKSSRELIEEVTAILKSTLSKEEKVDKALSVIDAYNEAHSLAETERIIHLEKTFDTLSGKKTFFDALESISIKLQRRVTLIAKCLAFNPSTSDQILLSAIQHFVLKEDSLDKTVPVEFLTQDEKDALNEGEKFRISLYKILLYAHMADAVKAGKLNLLYSNKYKAIQEYLLEEENWKLNRDDLIAKADLSEYKDFHAVMGKFKIQVDEKYKILNERFLSDENPHLKLDNNNKVIIHTPKIDSNEKGYVGSLLSQAGYVPILQVLSDIDHVSHYTEAFTHHSIKHKKMAPTVEMIFAGLLGQGCNIGLTRIANSSVGVDAEVLKNIVNWYFSVKNIRKANKKILSIINKLFLANAYRHDPAALHTSSDGRKMSVSVNSLHSNYSFKYFGKGKGVSEYLFIDERMLLYYSTIMSSAEREASYVIDGLQANEVVKSTIHSTDTHGFTEIVFAISPFVNVAFAPRIKDIGAQKIYSFTAKQTYENRGYKILPSRQINIKLIEQHWDDILRFMVTIKLKHTPASQLMKRLSSYAKDHPLYQALKEFGRITKSIFILTYLDDVELRQRIEKQLNKIELANKFSKAVFFANNRELQYGLQDEQEIIMGCKVLIQNAIILWNYLYLSQLIANNSDPEERMRMLEAIKRGSVVTWHHINLYGEYDFTKYTANQELFNMKMIMGLK
jgi:TnpA family transposase